MAACSPAEHITPVWPEEEDTVRAQVLPGRGRSSDTDKADVKTRAMGGEPFSHSAKELNSYRKLAPLHWTSSLHVIRLSSRGKASIQQVLPIPSNRVPPSVSLL